MELHVLRKEAEAPALSPAFLREGAAPSVPHQIQGGCCPLSVTEMAAFFIVVTEPHPAVGSCLASEVTFRSARLTRQGSNWPWQESLVFGLC